MKNKILLAGLLFLGLSLSACSSFTTETKEYSQVLTPMVGNQMVYNNIALEWLHSILVRARDVEKARAVQEAAEQGIELKPEEVTVLIEMTNPAYDPKTPDSVDENGDPITEFMLVDIQVIINQIDQLMLMNLKLAEGMDTLNESIQASRGLDPLFQELKKALTDEEVLTLIRQYGAKLLEKK